VSSIAIPSALAIAQSLKSCRQQTLNWFEIVESDRFYRQIHQDFSPIGWHLGHIAYIEAYWILERLAGLPPQFPQYHRLFAADGLPKTERQNLPEPAVILDYLGNVRSQVESYLAIASIESQARLWWWLIQHESQHNETIAFLNQLAQPTLTLQTQGSLPRQGRVGTESMVEVPAGEFILGSDRLAAQDNERPAHPCWLDTYWIDRYPVTCAQYRLFIEAGGYRHRDWWSAEGWHWLQNYPVDRPLYWYDAPEWADHPVCGVSAYEAEAYARFVGKRLPMEAEWEKAASFNPQSQSSHPYPWGDRPPEPHHANFNQWIGHTTPVDAYPEGASVIGCYDLLGNVWEWTASQLAPYPGFRPYPYVGYSQNYFDHQHYVLRGGSWATRPWGLRNSFRNWYHPWVRQMLAGFRCAMG
jgi:ergothioneine biosynthesis protein EgtB